MSKEPWLIEVHDEFDYERFAATLPTKIRDIMNTAIEDILAVEGIAVCSSSWGKALGQGLYEFRIRARSDSEFGLIRIFFTTHRNRVILLVGGYDKLREPSRTKQNREIALARRRTRD